MEAGGAGWWAEIAVGASGRLRVTALCGPCPCRALGQGGGPGTSRSLGPCWHGPVDHRAGPCPCQAKSSCLGPCQWAMCHLEIYNLQTAFALYEGSFDGDPDLVDSPSSDSLPCHHAH